MDFQSWFSNRILTKAVPIIPPSAFSVTFSKSSFDLIPKPIMTGFCKGREANRERYSSFFKTVFSFPVVEEELTAYKKPELKESKYKILSSEVSGVTKNVKFSWYFSNIF